MSNQHEDTSSGIAFAVSAYFLWGFLPLYLKALDHIGPVEVVAHRVIWSVPIALLVLMALRRTSDLMAALRNPRMLGMAAVTAALVTINWGIYVWAIAAERTVEAALGYYINPLFSMALGALLLGERLTRAQYVSVGLATAGVLYLTLQAGQVPWVALGLTVSWGFYAFFKRKLPIGPNQGFLLEVLILTPPAVAFLVWIGMRGEAAFLSNSFDTSMLLGAGIVTAVPLMLYANGAKGLRLSTIAILQYIAPTMIFLCAVLVFGEPFDAARQVAFPLIWAGLVVYSVSLLRQMRAKTG